MRTDNREDGIYGSIQPTKTGIFYGRITEIWEGYQWELSYCLDSSVDGVHRWLHGHKVPYNHIQIITEAL